MNRPSIFGIFVILVAATAISVASSAPKPDFSGTYVLDMQRTKMQTKPAVLGGEIVLEHRDAHFKFSRAFRIEGQEPLEASAYEVSIDGREIVKQEGDVTTRLSMIWDGDSLVFTVKVLSPKDGDGIHTARYRLEDGGKTLIAEESFRGPWRFDNLWVAVRK